MESNFEFLKKFDAHKYRDAIDAEQCALCFPNHTLTLSRGILEGVLLTVARKFEPPESNRDFRSLDLKNRIDKAVLWPGWRTFSDQMHSIRMAGNAAAHGDRHTPTTNRSEVQRKSRGSGDFDSLEVLKALHAVLAQVGRELGWPSFSADFVQPPQMQLTSIEETIEFRKAAQELALLHEDQEAKRRAAQKLRSLWQDGCRGTLRKNRTLEQVRDFSLAYRSDQHVRVFKDYHERLKTGSDLPHLDADKIATELQEVHAKALTEVELMLEREKEKIDVFERRERELKQELRRIREESSWTSSYPADDWENIPAFFEEKLLSGLAPFEEWSISPTEIGRGNFGVVYRCFPEAGGVPVAVKIPCAKHGRIGHDELKLVWEYEINSAATLAAELTRIPFDGIAKPLSFSPDTYPGFVVYEHIDGETLEKRLKGDPLSFFGATHVASELALILARLLQCQILYLDLAPRNIMMRGFRPTLIDPAPCTPSDVSPPEWKDCRHPLVTELSLAKFESGMVYCLGMLFLRMIGVNAEWGLQSGAASSISGSFSWYLKASPELTDDAIQARVRDGIRKAYESSARPSGRELDWEKLAALIAACVITDYSERSDFKLKVVGDKLRSYYDPNGIIRAISVGV